MSYNGDKWVIEPQLCINCKHQTKPNGIFECHHPDSDGWLISPVTGKIVWNPVSKWKGYCESTRSNGSCGLYGKYFERKEEKLSLFKKIFNFIKIGN